VVLHLRPSRDQVAGGLLERRALHRRHYPKGRRTVRRRCYRGVERIRASQPRCSIFLASQVISVLWGAGGCRE
jgi:hypothetical protein